MMKFLGMMPAPLLLSGHDNREGLIFRLSQIGSGLGGIITLLPSFFAHISRVGWFVTKQLLLGSLPPTPGLPGQRMTAPSARPWQITRRSLGVVFMTSYSIGTCGRLLSFLLGQLGLTRFKVLGPRTVLVVGWLMASGRSFCALCVVERGILPGPAPTG